MRKDEPTLAIAIVAENVCGHFDRPAGARRSSAFSVFPSITDLTATTQLGAVLSLDIVDHDVRPSAAVFSVSAKQGNGELDFSDAENGEPVGESRTIRGDDRIYITLDHEIPEPSRQS